MEKGWWMNMHDYIYSLIDEAHRHEARGTPHLLTIDTARHQFTEHYGEKNLHEFEATLMTYQANPKVFSNNINKAT